MTFSYFKNPVFLSLFCLSLLSPIFAQETPADTGNQEEAPTLPYQHQVRRAWFLNQGIKDTDFDEAIKGEDLPSGNFISEKEMTLLKLIGIRKSYPEKIYQIGFDAEKQDWFIRFYSGTKLFWSNARLIPEELLAKKDDFKPILYYDWVEQSFDNNQLSEGTIAGILDLYKPKEAETIAKEKTYYKSYFTELYGSLEEDISEDQLQETSFFGFWFKTHPYIVEPLKRAEMAIKKEVLLSRNSRNLDGLTKFISRVNKMGSWAWRKIAESNSVSYHSYGLAIDFIPKLDHDGIRDIYEMPGLYWAWDRNAGLDWLRISPADRWQIPSFIVEALEKEGFLWGGRWVNYDTIHFEYRPDLLLIFQLEREYKDYLSYLH